MNKKSNLLPSLLYKGGNEQLEGGNHRKLTPTTFGPYRMHKRLQLPPHMEQDAKGVLQQHLLGVSGQRHVVGKLRFSIWAVKHVSRFCSTGEMMKIVCHWDKNHFPCFQADHETAHQLSV